MVAHGRHSRNASAGRGGGSNFSFCDGSTRDIRYWGSLAPVNLFAVGFASGVGDLLGPDFHWGGKDQLYVVLDRLLAHRPALFTHLQARWKDLFAAQYEVLLYDLTSSYVEGQAQEIPKAQFGQEKENAMRRKKLARLLWTLCAMRRETSRDRLLLRLGAAKSKAGPAAKLVDIQLPAPLGPPKKNKTQKLEPGSFTFRLNRPALKEAELYDGHYLLRSNLTDKEPEWLWKLYMLLVEIEAVFKSFKNDLSLRPIYHSVGPRVDAHIFVCFLAYCLHVTLKQRLSALAPGLSPRAVLESLAGVQMLDLEVPTSDGRWLVMSRYTQPDKAVDLLLGQLKDEITGATAAAPERGTPGELAGPKICRPLAGIPRKIEETHQSTFNDCIMVLCADSKASRRWRRALSATFDKVGDKVSEAGSWDRLQS